MDSYIQWVGGKKGYAGDHYVAHRKHNQVWVLYDDAKVNKSPTQGQCAVNLAFFRNTNTRNPPPITVDLAKIRHLRRGRGKGGGTRGRGLGGVRGKGKGRGKSSTVSVAPNPINVTSADPISNVIESESIAVDNSQTIEPTVAEVKTSENVNQSETDATPVAPTTVDNVIQGQSDETPVVPTTSNRTSDNVIQSENSSTPVEPIADIADPLQQGNVTVNVENPLTVNIEETQPGKIPDIAGTDLDRELLDFLTDNTVGGASEPVQNVTTGTSEPIILEGNTGDDPAPPDIGNVTDSVPIIGHVELNTQAAYEKEMQEKFGAKFLVVRVKKHVNLLKRFQEGNVKVSPQKSAMHRLCKIKTKPVCAALYLNLDLIAQSIEPGQSVKVHTGEDDINASQPSKRKNPVPSSSSGSSDDDDKYAGDTEVEEDDQSIGLYGVRKNICRQVGISNI